MYEEQILNHLEQIEENTESQHLQLIYLVDNAQLMNEYTQEIISGDKLMQKEIQEVNQSVTLVAVILALFIILNFVERCFK